MPGSLPSLQQESGNEASLLEHLHQITTYFPFCRVWLCVFRTSHIACANPLMQAVLAWQLSSPYYLYCFLLRPYQFDLLIHKYSSQKKLVGRLIINVTFLHKLDTVTFSTVSLQSSFEIFSRSVRPQSVCSLRRNYRRKIQGCLSLFNFPTNPQLWRDIYTCQTSCI